MENLNAEQVKRGLECCANNDECVGEACPYYTTGCEKNMPKEALALINSQEQRIKELTEENERLNKNLETYKGKQKSIEIQRTKLVQENILLLQNKYKVDSKSVVLVFANGKARNAYAIVFDDADQIAKEMLEGE